MRHGFTLAELLIALVILGVLATFTIPKVLGTANSSERTSVFKEIIAAYTQANHTAYIQNKYVLGGGSCAANRYDISVIRNDLLNYTELCNTAEVDGCYIETINACAGGSGHRYANGASSCGLGICTTSGLPQDTVYLDWDGPDKGSNTIGDDQIRLLMCFGEGCNSGIRPGDTKPAGTESISLYSDIFK